MQYKHLQHAFTSLPSDKVLELGTHTNTRNHHLNGPHKKHLAGTELAADTDMKQAVTSCLHTLGTVSLYTGIQAFKPFVPCILSTYGIKTN